MAGTGDRGTRGGLRRGTTDFELQFNDYLHRRLKLSVRVLGIATVVFCVNSWVTHLVTGAWRGVGWFDGSRIMVLVAVAVAIVFLVILRRPRLTTRELVTIDAALAWGVIAICLAYYVTGYQRGPVFLVPILCLLLLGRAVFVPSTGRRTLILSLPAAPALLAIQLLHGEIWAEVGRPLSEAWYVSHVTWTQVIVGLSIALSMFASHVNFRLRRQAFDATQIGPYVVGEKIGEGAMGEVYRAEHALLRRPTAVKVIRSGMLSDQVLARFEQEVRQTARLTHPNTIQVYDYGRTPEGTFFYAMELLDGEDLRDLVERTGKMPPGRVVHILAQACAGLEEAHAIGLVHRDVKASNLILCRRGLEPDVVKVMDFGLVKDTRGEELSDTGIGPICGTLETLAPGDDSGADGRSGGRSLRARSRRLLPAHGSAGLRFGDARRVRRPAPAYRTRPSVHPGVCRPRGSRDDPSPLPGEGTGGEACVRRRPAEGTPGHERRRGVDGVRGELLVGRVPEGERRRLISCRGPASPPRFRTALPPWPRATRRSAPSCAWPSS